MKFDAFVGVKLDRNLRDIVVEIKSAQARSNAYNCQDNLKGLQVEVEEVMAHQAVHHTSLFRGIDGLQEQEKCSGKEINGGDADEHQDEYSGKALKAAMSLNKSTAMSPKENSPRESVGDASRIEKEVKLSYTMDVDQ